MATELAVREIKQDSMLSIIERAVMSPEFDVNKMQQLLELRERFEKNEARKAFVAAMNAFKAHPPSLEKVKKVDFQSKGGTRVHYNYAPLDHISKVLGEALSKHGLSFRWNTQQLDGSVQITCVLQHSEGHSESVTLSAGLHADDRMNLIQRLGSTITYLQRYTLLAATGMATEEQDTDGNERFSELDERLEWVANCRTAEELNTVFNAAFKEAKAVKDAKACLLLVEARDKKRGEFRANS